MEATTLRELASQAYQQSLLDEAALQEKEKAAILRQIEAALSNLFGQRVTATRTNAYYQNTPVIKIDDLHFTLTGQGDMGKQLVFLGTCPSCQQECASEPINHLAQLGQLMSEFDPDSDHRCQ